MQSLKDDEALIEALRREQIEFNLAFAKRLLRRLKKLRKDDQVFASGRRGADGPVGSFLTPLAREIVKYLLSAMRMRKCELADEIAELNFDEPVIREDFVRFVEVVKKFMREERKGKLLRVLRRYIK